ncbi:pilus assembly protein Flp/PilA [Rhizobium petrolearium]|uniref:Flp family type IVb pilin n=1 Tax=Neorhizobium petrolearium TaxID=515361 RepID=UPI001AE1061E|nr:Flp family type IVb pilin [Neorhizobium petrolearium]MBP1845281.1 pilus assembly protein Flp/PilA [Neorhizobium petrolearium]
MRLFSSLFKNNSGATAVEYGLLISILALTLFVALGDYYELMNNMFGGIADAYEDATP